MKVHFFLIILLFSACTTAQINQTLGDVLDSYGTPTTAEVSSGLREALIKGISRGADQASALNGYLGNPQIRIPFPPQIKKVENTLRDVGLNKQVDEFIESLNRGAEKAAKEAKPIFINAITSMTIEDAWSILRGDQDAATSYLRRKTSADLRRAFQPVIHESLESVHATRYYDDIIGAYNKLPFVQKADTDLDAYVTERAMDGLFYLIAQEEAKIREDPGARTTELLRKVFAQQD